MRKTLAIVLISITITAITGIIYALTTIGVVEFGYKITPSAQPPTMIPSTVNLDLGDIPSGSSGTKDFGKVATLNLPLGYEINFTLDRNSAIHFPTFDVTINIYKEGVFQGFLLLKNNDIFYCGSIILDAGTYDVYMSVKYTAASVASETTGTIIINVSY